MLRYFISREFLFTLLGLAGAGLLLYLLIFFVVLPSYTRHGDGVLVPNVQRVSFEEAVKQLKDAKLRFEVKDSTFQQDFDPLTVLGQYPPPLSRVKSGRKVFLTLNRRSVPMVRMPIPNPKDDNISLYQAKRMLENWNLLVGEVTSKPDDAKRNYLLEIRYNGRVISQGTKVPQGAKIDLVISKGGQEARVALPDLLGMRLEEALEVVRSQDLAIGSITYRNGDDPFKDGLIIIQSPDPLRKDSVKASEIINVIIQGQPEENLESSEGETVEDAEG